MICRRASALLLTGFIVSALAGGQTVRIGLVTGESQEVVSAKFRPFTDYLSSQVPGRSFEMLRLGSTEELSRRAEHREVEFAFSTPIVLVELELTNGARCIATSVQSGADGQASSWMASAVFVRNDRSDIRSMADARSKSVIALDRRALGGWLAALREWNRLGIDPHNGLGSVRYVFSYELLVDEVCNKTADIGVMSASAFASVRQRCPGALRVLRNPHGRNSQFPFEASTQWYPEAGFAAVSDDEDLIARVAVALLRIQPGSDAAGAANVRNFVAPLSYATVENLMQELRVGPYESYGQLTFTQAVQQHAIKVLAILVGFILVLTAAFVRSRYLNRRLQASEQRLRTLFDDSSESIFVYDRQGRFLEANAVACQRLGYTREELLRLSLQDIVGGGRSAGVPERVVRVISEGEATFESVHRRKDGSEFPVEVSAVPLPYDRIPAILAVARDISKRKQAEEALRINQERLRLALEATSDAIWDWDLETNTAYYSPRWYTMLGYEPNQFPASYETWASLTEPEDGKRASEIIADAVKTGAGCEVEYRMRAACGSWVWIQARGKVSQRDEQGKPIRISGTNTDITEHKHAEEERERLQSQLAQAQKLEGLGRLAGGVAHDFNNLLTVINGYSDIVFGELPPNDPLRASVEQVRKAGTRAAELTHQLLAFGRKQMIQPKPLDLNFVTADAEPLLRRLLGEDIELVTRLSPDLGQVRADSGQIHQVLMNLAANARDAMPDGGTFVIETTNAAAPEDTFPEAVGVATVRLSVSDSGTGFDEETRKLIFEPFFTTKPVGAGTGLGLAMIYGIVKQGQGWIDVKSEVGKGSRFDIYWPRIDSVAIPVAPPVAAAINRPVSGTILLVEDQDEVRKFATTVLRHRGFHVISAADGKKALSLAEDHPGLIDLIVTDVIMPGMNGHELARRIGQMRPGIRVLYTSGYGSEVIATRGVLEHDADYLPKPYDSRVLCAKVCEVLVANQKSVS